MTITPPTRNNDVDLHSDPYNINKENSYCSNNFTTPPPPSQTVSRNTAFHDIHAAVTKVFIGLVCLLVEF